MKKVRVYKDNLELTDVSIQILKRQDSLQREYNFLELMLDDEEKERQVRQHSTNLRILLETLKKPCAMNELS